MSNQQNIDNYFNNLQARIQKAVTIVIPIMANDTVNWALDNFNTESYEGRKWPARKDKKNTRKLLVKSGRLKRSVRTVSTRASGYSVGSDVPYAAVHNFGDQINRAASSETFVRNRKLKGKGKGRFTKGTTSGKGFSKAAYNYKMPQRQFLGASPVLAKRLVKLARTEMLKAING
ncbi:MAG: hypothetical protein EOO42_01080 [Flavobacteriales bacterium]|nr:MAG: hypothetical protein EOO42_01080 [Flavobacteriales bacterium]